MLTLLFGSLIGCTMSAYVDKTLPEPTWYRMTALEILSSPDPDRDGVEENHLPSALDGIAAALPEQGFDVDSLNDRMADTIAQRTPIFVGAASAEETLSLTVQSGTDASASDEAEGGLVGAIDINGAFSAGPGYVEVSVAIGDDLDAVPFGLYETLAEGDLDEYEIVGTFSTLLSIESVVREVVEPTIPEEGWDLDWDGEPESKRQVMDLVMELAPLAADARLPDGSPAITAVLAFAAERAE